MIDMRILIQILSIIVGYAFGLFQTAYIYGKLHGIDIREHGSGNSGTTNALRVLGKKAGLIVFLGDLGKAVVACVLARLVGMYFFPDMMYTLILLTGFGVVLGHNFPFYMGFKGGKGIAASAGLLASTDWRVMLVCLVVFVAAVAITRYVSLGSILVMICFFIGMVFFGARGDFGIAAAHLTEFYVLAGLISAMGIWRHHTNIKRLLSGTENKLGARKE